MPLHLQAQTLLEQMATLGLPPLETLSPAQARSNSRLRPYAPGPEVAKVDDHLIWGQEGEITARIYTPEGSGPFPILVWFHGGGWVFGDLDRADGTARHLTVAASCVVVSVDYRLAPDTKFPGPAEDCYAATKWVAQNAPRFNGYASKIAVGGDSAGGNLAAAVSLMAHDRNDLALEFQLLVYPAVDRDFDTESYRSNSDGYSLTKDAMVWFWNHYLRDEADASNPYASPMKYSDLSGLPPALVITAEFDPLCSEGEAYAQRLQAAGVSTEYTCYEGMIHGFFGMSAALDSGKQAIAQAGEALRIALRA